MASGLTRNQMPGNRLRVRIPCPPLLHARIAILADAGLPAEPGIVPGSGKGRTAPLADAGLPASPGIVPGSGSV